MNRKTLNAAQSSRFSSGVCFSGTYIRDKYLGTNIRECFRAKWRLLLFLPKILVILAERFTLLHESYPKLLDAIETGKTWVRFIFNFFFNYCFSLEKKNAKHQLGQLNVLWDLSLLPSCSRLWNSNLKNKCNPASSLAW